MFLEASFGANFHHQEGCSITGGEPNYCRTGLSVTPAGNRNQSGFGNIPYLFPDATVLDPNTFTLLGAQPGRHDDVGRHPDPGAAAVRLGHAGRQSAAPQHRPVRQQSRRHRRHQLHPRYPQPDLECERDEGARAAHAQERATTTSAACSGAARATSPAISASPTTPTTRSTRRSAMPTPRSACSAPTRRPRGGRKARTWR